MYSAEHVRRILASRGLTLHEVSRRSGETFGRSSPYFVPHNLYYDLRIPSRYPSLYQLVALSQITRYRLCDWLRVFDFRLDDIPRLQPVFARPGTVLLDASIYDENAWIPWFRETGAATVLAIAPLARYLAAAASKRAGEFASLGKQPFLYSRIGQQDWLAFPDLLPGSIVRVNGDEVKAPSRNAGHRSDRIFLVEHQGALHCGRLQRIENGEVVLCSAKFPFETLELALDVDSRILGVVDAELRSLVSAAALPSRKTTRAAPPLKITAETPRDLKSLLQASRRRTGLSFREGSHLTRQIAEKLADTRYFIASSTLSDYETLTQLPRQVHKLIALCVVYCIGFLDLLRAAGMPQEVMEGDPIPDGLIPRVRPRATAAPRERGRFPSAKSTSPGFLERIGNRWEELPLFAKEALAVLSGVGKLSLSDIFWVGEDKNPIHPYLKDASFVVVNRRIKRPESSPRKMLWTQPLYMLVLRNGRYLCGACTLKGDRLEIHPYPDRSFLPRQLRNRVDAEVVGQVAAIVRRL